MTAQLLQTMLVLAVYCLTTAAESDRVYPETYPLFAHSLRARKGLHSVCTHGPYSKAQSRKGEYHYKSLFIHLSNFSLVSVMKSSNNFCHSFCYQWLPFSPWICCPCVVYIYICFHKKKSKLQGLFCWILCGLLLWDCLLMCNEHEAGAKGHLEKKAVSYVAACRLTRMAVYTRKISWWRFSVFPQYKLYCHIIQSYEWVSDLSALVVQWLVGIGIKQSVTVPKVWFHKSN